MSERIRLNGVEVVFANLDDTGYGKSITIAVDKETETAITEWARAKHPLGYGNMRISGKTQYAHRVVYEALVGEIPAGYSLDHLCRVSACINPDHLQPVTHKENVLRGVGPTAENSQKTHCQHGHEFTKENTRITVVGGRLCRTCDKIYKEKWNKRFSEANRALGLTAKGKKPTLPNRIGARI